jgi:hypothetical protein
LAISSSLVWPFPELCHCFFLSFNDIRWCELFRGTIGVNCNRSAANTNISSFWMHLLCLHQMTFLSRWSWLNGQAHAITELFEKTITFIASVLNCELTIFWFQIGCADACIAVDRWRKIPFSVKDLNPSYNGEFIHIAKSKFNTISIS